MGRPVQYPWITEGKARNGNPSRSNKKKTLRERLAKPNLTSRFERWTVGASNRSDDANCLSLN